MVCPQHVVDSFPFLCVFPVLRCTILETDVVRRPANMCLDFSHPSWCWRSVSSPSSFLDLSIPNISTFVALRLRVGSLTALRCSMTAISPMRQHVSVLNKSLSQRETAFLHKALPSRVKKGDHVLAGSFVVCWEVQPVLLSLAKAEVEIRADAVVISAKLSGWRVQHNALLHLVSQARGIVVVPLGVQQAS